MAHRISRLILEHNAGRDPARLALKFARLRQDVFSFFRGTNHLFLNLLPRLHPLWRAPRLHVCGDLHLENFGTYKGDNRLCYFDINDFDEVCLAPVSIDIVRFLTSLHAASAALRWTARQRDSLARCFIDAYCAAIFDGKPRWVERSLAEGAVRLLLKRAASTQSLQRFVRSRGWRRQAISLARSSFQGLSRAWKQYAADYDAGRIVD
ncbi:MAG: DUF2252 family protein [Steroidobacteraceae bacterium]